jgi:large subunit ribosomal protein L4
MQLKTLDTQSPLDMTEVITSTPFNESLVHQIVVAYLAGARAGTRAHKNRSAVRGGGSKPWKQKGTGQARAGSIRSPIWRGGGKTFAATNQDYTQKVNKKMYRGGMRSIVAELLRQDRLSVVVDLTLDQPKTKSLINHLRQLKLETKGLLIVTAEWDEKLELASRNLIDVNVCDVAALNPVNLVGAQHVLLTSEALRRLEGWLS